MRGIVAWILILNLVAIGCATSPGTESGITAEAPETQSIQTAPPPASPGSTDAATEVTRSAELEELPVGLMTRRIGELYGGGLVVMHGTNMYTPVGPYSLRDETMERVVLQIAAALPSSVATKSDGYYFVHPPDQLYESLNGMSLADELHDHYEGLTAAATFGIDTPLFNAFALLGHTLGITIVGDNAITDALTGELAVGELPLADTLAAVLKSARVSDQGFRIESTPEYIFLRHVNNPVRHNLLLNESELSTDQEQLLERTVNIALPVAMDSPAQVASLPGAHSLGHVQAELSRQLGIEVRTEPGMDKLPVNPVVMNGVRVRTAMDLLIRQWPLAQFAYELAGDVIVIRYVGPQ